MQFTIKSQMGTQDIIKNHRFTDKDTNFFRKKWYLYESKLRTAIYKQNHKWGIQDIIKKHKFTDKDANFFQKKDGIV